jgi:DNA-binding PadR family transcriptional regulator
MPKDLRLSPPSYIVLGLVAASGVATPYELKNVVAGSVGQFWTVPHAQIYSEAARLAEAGLLDERREQGGRRRRFYELTDEGKAVFAEWLAAPTGELFELRDLGLLKLYFGAEPRPFAEVRLPIHEHKLAALEERVRVFGDEIPPGVRLAIEAGIGHEREWIRYWSALAAGEASPTELAPAPPEPDSVGTV